MDLRFADEWGAEFEPNGSAWSGAGSFDELDPLDLLDHASIPEPGLAEPPPTSAWNLGATLRRVAVTATVCAPLLLSASSALASPPDPSLAAPPIGSPAQAGASIWDALIDHKVILTLIDGSQVSGTVLGVSGQALVVARQGDGLMLTIATASVSDVYVDIPPRAPAPARQIGTGSIVWGAITTTIGGSLAVAAAWTTADCLIQDDWSCTSYSLGIGIPSLVHLALGIPLLVHGINKRKRYRDANPPLGPIVSGFVSPTREGVSAGLGIRF